MTTAKSYRTKALGWYTVQQVRIVDWLHVNRYKDLSIDSTESLMRAQHDTKEPKTERQFATSKDTQRLQAVVRESHTILAKAHAVFPLQLFPDHVNIDCHKLTIVHRQFLGVEQTVSVPIENIKNIEADFGPFFGSITVTSDYFTNNTQTVNNLWRDDAKTIQRLVQGAVVAQREEIDLNKIDAKQLRALLIDLGSGHTKSMNA